jgi:hypothetical protein
VVAPKHEIVSDDWWTAQRHPDYLGYFEQEVIYEIYAVA